MYGHGQAYLNLHLQAAAKSGSSNNSDRALIEEKEIGEIDIIARAKRMGSLPRRNYKELVE